MPKLRHLAIVTANRERLVKFYIDAFDLKVIYGRPHSTHLSDGNFNLAIVDKIGDAKARFLCHRIRRRRRQRFGRNPEECRRNW